MAGFKQPDFIERQEAAAKARRVALESFRAKAADPALAEELKARTTHAAERKAIKLARVIEKVQKKAHETERAEQGSGTLRSRPRVERPKRSSVNAHCRRDKRRRGTRDMPPAKRDRSGGSPKLVAVSADSPDGSDRWKAETKAHTITNVHWNTTTSTEKSAHMATDQISFYDGSLNKQIEGSFKSDGNSIHVSSVHGTKSVPYSDIGACNDYNAQVLLVQKLLSELARDPGSGMFKDLQDQKDNQELQPTESFSMWASGVGTNP